MINHPFLRKKWPFTIDLAVALYAEGRGTDHDYSLNSATGWPRFSKSGVTPRPGVLGA